MDDRKAKAELGSRGDLRVTFTYKEAAAVHLAAELVLKTLGEKATNRAALSRGLGALREALEAQGCQLDPDRGWVV